MIFQYAMAQEYRWVTWISILMAVRSKKVAGLSASLILESLTIVGNDLKCKPFLAVPSFQLFVAMPEL